MLGVSADARAECVVAKRQGGTRASPVQSGEEFTMRFMKSAMAIAAVCVAMLSLTMAVRHKRQGQGQGHGKKTGRSRA